MSRSIRVLYVGDDARTARRVERSNDRLETTTASSVQASRETLRTGAVDCVVSRVDLHDGTGFDLLETVRDRYGDLPFVLFPAAGSERLASRALRRDATDYVSGTDAEDPDEELAARIVAAVEGQRESVFERLPVGAIEWNDSVEVGRCNAEAEAILGYDRAELRGESWDAIVPDDERDAVREVIDDLRAGEQRATLVTRNRTASGETVSCKWHHRGVTDDSGALRSIVSTFEDVTDRVERERRVERLRNKLRQLAFTRTRSETARAATDAAEEVMAARLSGVHLLSEDGETLGPGVLTETASEAFERVPRYERDAAPGTRAGFVWDVFESGESRRVDDIAADDRIREPTPAGSVIVHPLGDHGVFIVSAPEPEAFTDTDEALAEILARTLTTALDRVEREQQRHERERQLSRLHEATRDLIASETEADVATRTVEAAEEILGFSIVLVRLYDEETGWLVPVAESETVDDYLPPREPFTPEDGALNWDAYENGDVAVYDDIEETDAIDSGSGLRSLLILPLGEYGTLSVGEMTPNAFDDTDVSLARILATTVETVLEAHERKTALRRQRDELEAQNARLERFADVLSHDLRNPLTVAQGRLRLAIEDCDSPHHETIERAHDRMETLIDDLLTLARNGGAVEEPETVHLPTLLRRCWDTVKTDDAELQVSTDATVEADPNRLRQLIENLIRNSVEHGSTSEGADDGVTITVGDLPEGGFYFEDDGHGIPEEHRSKVFEFGFTDSADGTGFGLSIVASIAEAHGWTVDLTESDTGGARFEFRT